MILGATKRGRTKIVLWPALRVEADCPAVDDDDDDVCSDVIE